MSMSSEAHGPVLQVQDLHMSYGKGGKLARILAGVDFEVQQGEFVCVVGPSGSGKTTLLRCIAGLQNPTFGRTVLEGDPVVGPPEKLAVVFQDYSRSLLPWMNVRRNVELPLERKYGRTQRRQIAEEALTSVGLEGKGELFPWQLSGGMQQRAAIARGLAYQPDILLMDEPFAAVDAQTRVELEDLVLRVREQYDMTVLFVTHDIDEAVYLADRVIVLSGAPTSVTEDLRVDLPRPRHQIHTKALPRYAELRNHVFTLIQEAKSHASVPSADTAMLIAATE